MGEVSVQLLGAADWLMEELEAMGGPGTDGSGPDRAASDRNVNKDLGEGFSPGYRLVGRVLSQELMIRRLQAAEMRAVAQAADLIVPVRRDVRSRKRSGGGRGESGDEGAGGDQGGEGLASSSISAEQLLSARLAPELNLHPLTAAVEVGVAVGLVRDLPLIMGL
ncbi:hypothetical protein, partial [Kineosporia sp. NBRC 101731]|uniref:hypothetical protein n=1 Tax=Kineosporia sp. NBRC 101731 TaxID=3032199 RepID=UPI0025551196